jgi:hypothetical protein
MPKSWWRSPIDARTIARGREKIRTALVRFAAI